MGSASYRYAGVDSPIGDGSDEYIDLDLSFQPDGWTYQAVMHAGHRECALSRIEEEEKYFMDVTAEPIRSSVPTVIKTFVNRNGNQAVTTDTFGSNYDRFASEAGYKLRCSKLPTRSTVELIFALLSMPSRLLPPSNVQGPPGGITGGGGAITGGWKDLFNEMGPRPMPSKIDIDGSYSRAPGPKKYHLSQRINVDIER